MSDLSTGQIGPETKYDVAFANGALQLTLTYVGTQANLSVTGSISASQLVDALAQKLTNQTEKSILLVVESIIKSIP